ncbi:MAG: aquaporin [Verrucomicrobia bacterium]|nr:aquaporin [Verrucomicrobiota bacterium]
MKIKSYIVEFIGTFFLVLTVCVAAVFGTAGAMAPVAIGLVLAFMIYGGGHLSGGHFNPAVTLGVCLRGKCDFKDLPFYWLAQVLAAVVAVFTARALVPGGTVETANLDGKTVPVMIAEFLFTFALVWTVLNTATAKGTAGNSFYGIAIGGIVLVGAFTVGSISLGAFNPAVAAGLAVIGKLPLAMLGVYLVTQLAAAVVAAVAFKLLAGDQD